VDHYRYRVGFGSLRVIVAPPAQTRQQLKPLSLALYKHEVIIRAKCLHSWYSIIRHNPTGNFVATR
jgi:hypothetical protein